MTSPCLEKVIQFGDTKGLVGIASLPPEVDASLPAVVLLNAGLIHRVGPFRVHVDLARRLAAAGWLVFRIDQSGLGDSQPRRGDLTYEERAVLDATDAMDALSERFGVKRFVLVGLCAGAMSVHRAALEDQRVVGACLLDGYAYPTMKYTLYSNAAKAAAPAFWRRSSERALTALRETLERVSSNPPPPRPGSPSSNPPAARGASSNPPATRGSSSNPPATPPARSSSPGVQLSPIPPPPREERPGQDAEQIFAQDWPPRDVIAAELDGILMRGVRVLFVYTGGWSSYVHPEQFDEMFPRLSRRDQVEVEMYAEADHTYLVVEHRERMLARVERFVASFGRL